MSGFASLQGGDSVITQVQKPSKAHCDWARRPRVHFMTVLKFSWNSPGQYSWASLVAQVVKHPPTMWETRVRSLGWEDPLEKGKATYSSILGWRIPWTV